MMMIMCHQLLTPLLLGGEKREMMKRDKGRAVERENMGITDDGPRLTLKMDDGLDGETKGRERKEKMVLMMGQEEEMRRKWFLFRNRSDGR